MTDSSDKNEFFDGPTLSADGRLEGRIEAVEPAPTFQPAAPGAPELELDRRPPQPVVELPPDEPPPEPKRGSGAVKYVVAFLLLGAVAFVALLVLRPRIPVPDGVTDTSFFRGLGAANGQLVIVSEPSGATVIIDGEKRGQTPWAVDNRWSGTVKVRLEARGYKAWEGTFSGGQDQSLDVQLKK